MSYFGSIKFLLGKKFKLLMPMVLIFLMSSLVDLFGIGLIGGYVGIIIDPSNVNIIQEMFPAFEFLSNYSHEQTILFFGYILFFTFLVKFFLVLFINHWIFKFSYFEQAKIQKIMINGFLNQDYETFIQSKSADSLASISQYSSLYKDVLIAILTGLSSLLVIIAAFIMLAIVSIKTVAMLILMIFTIFFIYNLKFGKKLDADGRTFTAAAANLFKGTQEAAEGIKEIKVLGKEAFFIDSVSDSAEKIAQGGVRLNMFTIIPRNIIEVALIGFIVLIISINVYLDANLGATLSVLSVFAAAMIRITPSISLLQSSANSIVFGKESILLLARIMKDKGVDINLNLDELQKKPKKINPKVTKIRFNQLKLEDISYTYPNSLKPSIYRVNLEINKGDFIGLIGPSGAGKTTLVDLILGFLKPSNGTLKFNDKDAHDDISAWLSQCAYLPQDIFLINGTLKENITLSRENIKLERLEEAIKLSKLAPIIQDLPDGLDTDIGDKGVRLSGGQRQRVSIARAIFNKSEVLLLDESTSALDSKTEADVINELMTLRNEKTIISIAHRISTLKECNKIYKVANGSVEGPFSYEEISVNNA
ncbi:ABC transporter ATP-binding protein/permease [Gammaproteobacteria bacterium]|nr:ABC transporter ATP-binding protein/permease [Gammaproteobacteria bacterium]